MEEDGIIRTDTNPFCYRCKLGGIKKSARTDNPVDEESTRPGQVLFLDIIPNTHKRSLTPKTHFSNYLIIVCAYSRYCVMIGLNGTTSNNIAEALQLYCVNHGPRLGFKITDIDRLHADAGTQFLSEPFINWAKDNNISVKAAAPEHQHQNGLVER
jgi:hypothetical protein